MSDEMLRLELTMRRSARNALDMVEGDYWPSDVAAAQARAVFASDWLRDHDAAIVAKARIEALREAADDIQTGARRGWAEQARIAAEWLRKEAKRWEVSAEMEAEESA